MASGNDFRIEDMLRSTDHFSGNTLSPIHFYHKLKNFSSFEGFFAIPRIQGGHLVHGRVGERICFALLEIIS